NGLPAVLVVDEGCELADSLRGPRSAGYAVETAANPVEALELLSERPYAVVVARSGAHDIAGIELSEQAAVHGGDVSILMLTKSADAPNVSRSISARTSDFLTEPFTQTELIDRVEGALRRRMLSEQRVRSDERGLESLASRFHYLYDSVARSLSAALSLTHKPTFAHCERVAL